jgi:hypothetical protein
VSTYDIDPGVLAPPLVVTLTDTNPIDTGAGVVLQFTDEAGNLLFTDAAPAVDATNPLAVLVTHTWVAGQTDVPGIYGVQALVGGDPWPVVTWSIGQGGTALYCTLTQARQAGATGSDQEVTDAIKAARRRIDRFTGDTFAPTQLEVTARVAGDGTALLPRRVIAVSRVTPVTAVGEPVRVPLPAASWRAVSSRSIGQVDAVLIGGLGYGDALIAGAEPWRGGWGNLLGNLGTGQVEVVGTFGWDEPPPEVVAAAALLASAIRAGTLDGVTPAGPDTDDEGNVVKVTASAPGGAAPGERTTGLAAADAQLAGLVRSRFRLAGV